MLRTYTFPDEHAAMENPQSNIITGNNYNSNYHITIINESKPEGQSRAPFAGDHDETGPGQSSQKKSLLKNLGFANLDLRLSNMQTEAIPERSTSEDDDNFTFKQRPSLHVLENTPKQINLLNDRLQIANSQKKDFLRQGNDTEYGETSIEKHFQANPSERPREPEEEPRPVERVQETEPDEEANPENDDQNRRKKASQTEDEKTDLIKEESKKVEPKTKRQQAAQTDKEEPLAGHIHSKIHLSGLSKASPKRKVKSKLKSISSDFSFSKKHINKNIMQAIAKQSPLGFGPKKPASREINRAPKKKTKRLRFPHNFSRPVKAGQKNMRKKKKLAFMKIPESVLLKQRQFNWDQSIQQAQVESPMGFLRGSEKFANLKMLSQKSQIGSQMSNQCESPTLMYKSLKQFYKKKRKHRKTKRNKERSTSRLNFRRKKQARMSQIQKDDSLLSSNCLNETFRFDITHENKNTVILVHKNDNLLQKLKEYAIKNRLTVCAFEQLVRKVKKKLRS